MLRIMLIVTLCAIVLMLVTGELAALVAQFVSPIIAVVSHVL